MRKITLLLLIIYSTVSCCQENSLEPNRFRMQGYLFIQTSLKDSLFMNKGKISIPLDNPKWYFFKPLNSILPSLKETVESFENSIDSVLYLPVGLTESKQNIESINYSLRKFLKNDDIEIFSIPERKRFIKKEKTTVKIVGDIVSKRVYEIVYIDGIWQEVKIPFKWKEVLSIGKYRSNNLNPKNKNGYSYYFLKEIKFIGYKLDINDDTVILQIP